MGTGWAGGIAHGTELCGAVAAGICLIGAKYGRVSLDDDDREALERVRRFRERFTERRRSLQCRDLKIGPFGPEAHRACAAVVRDTMELLLDELDGT